MRLRKFLGCTALVSVGLVNANANSPVPPDELKQPMETSTITEIRRHAAATGVSLTLPPAPSPLVEEDKALGEAYYNTLGILREDNSCSKFFGGPTGAVMVFNTFMGQVRKDYLARSIGMRMSGSVTNGLDFSTKTKFRLFNKVRVNANGPFYRKKVSPSEPSAPQLGSYEPNTKEIRVLILLHELGHLMKGDDGNWLLPDDGKAEAISHDNTEKIKEVCGDQIKGLSKAGQK